MSEAEHDALRALWLLLQKDAREYERQASVTVKYEHKLRCQGRAGAYRVAAMRLGKACGFSKRVYPGVVD